MREHDVEEFSEIIERHGLWEKGIESFAAAVREADYQMNIDDVNRLQRVK
ncbi:putative metallopeptidase [Bacillus licheniformis]